MSELRPLLSVVVPVFNQATSIVGNLEVVRERLAAELTEAFEIVVVSDGSIDATEGELLAQAPGGSFRVFHYDRNLGKGYAVKLGALEARGDWIGFVDADLDLDPAYLAFFVARAREANLDIAIGSKRHPDSAVVYPRSRVIASWLFQQLVRVLFRLNVRDTQVGLKVFRREVAEQVLPLLLVKRYAFDIELLAVANAFGFTRIEELPIRLDYQFTGSGVRSRAVVRALVDTAAIFYRLRILRYYQRRRRLSGAYGFTRPRLAAPTVTVLLPPELEFRERDFPSVELVEVPEAATLASYQAAADHGSHEVIAILAPGVRAAGNWLSATTPFLARSEIDAVVTPKMAPATGSRRERAAAAVVESRVGAGLGYFRYTPGNLRYVSEFPATAIVIRRAALVAAPGDAVLEDLPEDVARRGGKVLYTPESVVVADPEPLFGPHLRASFRRGRKRGRAVRHGHLTRPRPSSGWALAVLIVVAIALFVFFDLSLGEAGGVALVAGYVFAVLVASAAATLRYQSISVGALAFVGIVTTHVLYVTGFCSGLVAG